MIFVRLAGIKDFRFKKIRSFSLLGKRVAIIRHADGSYSALEANCKHQGADLTMGKISDNIATCPWHGWRYDLDSGQCLNHESLPLRKYAVRVEGEDILVSLHPRPESDD